MGKKVSTKEYAKLIGISRQKVVDQINSGTLPASRKGRGYQIDLDAAKNVVLRSNNLLGENSDTIRDDSGNPQISPLNKARTEKEQAQAKIKNMEAEKMAGGLVEAREMKKQAFKEGRRVREAFTNMPSRIAAELACETDPHKLEALLASEIRKILEGLAIK